MDAKPRILSHLSKSETATGFELRSLLGITRQALNVHLRTLIESGRVTKSGSTRGARYALAERGPAPRVVTRDLAIPGLDEAVIFEEISLVLGLAGQLRRNVEAIVRYAFTEVLNNAIDHSEAARCNVTLRLDSGTVAVVVRDPGIGVFHSIASKLKIPDESTAMIELLKGRTTTMAERHSGEGLFFASKAADRFVLRSHRIEVEWNHARDDVFVSERRFLRGTRVEFLLHRGTRRRLDAVFGEYAPEEYDYRFEKTRVHVKLLRADYVSRSEAKRLLANLEKFREIVLDFEGVGSIGQGFADEIFRVFARRNPEIRIWSEHANSVIRAMLAHVAP